MKKLLALVFLMTMAGKAGLFAIDINLTPPQLDTSNSYAAVIQGYINNAFSQARNELNSMVRGISSNPQEMIRAFANSSVFASTGASLRTFQGYNTFALTVGVMAGVQFPPNIFSIVEDITGLADMDDEGLPSYIMSLFNDTSDLRLGINPQILNAQIGINTRFLKGLYLGVKGGYMNIPPDLIQIPLSFQTWSAGPLINYQLIPQLRLFGGLIVWRGLNVGAGFIYQNTSLSLDLSLGDRTFPIPMASTSLPTEIGEINGKIIDPRFHFGFTVNTYTVPLEAVTSIRLLGFFNASLGVGADLGFGKASLIGDLNGGLDLDGYQRSGLRIITPGSVSASLDGESSPTFFNPKIMASLGFSAGPAIILDIPITYYFQNTGFNVGVSLGIAL